MDQVGVFKFPKVTVDCFIIRRTLFRLDIVGYRPCREGFSYVGKGELDDSFKLIYLPYLVSFYDIGENCGVVDVFYDSVGLLLRERVA